jgi:hypothetical protein
MKTPPARQTEKLPDPWLFETVLQIPITNPNATHFGIQLAVTAIYNLSENLRYLLHLHREQQRAIRKQHENSLAQALSKPASGEAQILHLHPSAPSNSHALKNVKSRAASRREAIAKRRRPTFSDSNSANRVA